MGLSISGYVVLAVLIGAPITAIIAAGWAFKKQRVVWEDLGIVALPPIAFIVVGYFRPQIHLGWAMFLWPLIILILGLYAFALKVAVVDRWYPTVRRNSRLLAALFTGGAVILGSTVGPWYE
jgi:hypothetical protein